MCTGFASLVSHLKKEVRTLWVIPISRQRREGCGRHQSCGQHGASSDHGEPHLLVGVPVATLGSQEQVILLIGPARPVMLPDLLKGDSLFISAFLHQAFCLAQPFGLLLLFRWRCGIRDIRGNWWGLAGWESPWLVPHRASPSPLRSLSS